MGRVLDCRVGQELGEEGCVLDAEACACALVRAGRVRGVAYEADAAFVVRGEGVVAQIEDGPLWGGEVVAVSFVLWEVSLGGLTFSSLSEHS